MGSCDPAVPRLSTWSTTSLTVDFNSQTISMIAVILCDWCDNMSEWWLMLCSCIAHMSLVYKLLLNASPIPNMCKCIHSCLRLTQQVLDTTMHTLRLWRAEDACYRPTYARNWGLNRREGVCSKGPYFQELLVEKNCLPLFSLHTIKHVSTVIVLTVMI